MAGLSWERDEPFCISFRAAGQETGIRQPGFLRCQLPRLRAAPTKFPYSSCKGPQGPKSEPQCIMRWRQVVGEQKHLGSAGQLDPGLRLVGSLDRYLSRAPTRHPGSGGSLRNQRLLLTMPPTPREFKNKDLLSPVQNKGSCAARQRPFPHPSRRTRRDLGA